MLASRESVVPRSLGAQLHLEHALARHRILLERAAHALAQPGRSAPRPQSRFAHSLARRLEAGTEPSPPPATPASVERFERHTVQPGDTLWALAIERFHVSVDELARQNGIRDPRALVPGRVLRVQRTIDSSPRRVVASWYGPGFDGKPMANGQPYDRHARTIAHRSLPLGTRVELRNPRTGVTVEARVDDRGPYVAGREVDLSWRLARDLELLEAGVGELEMRVLG